MLHLRERRETGDLVLQARGHAIEGARKSGDDVVTLDGDAHLELSRLALARGIPILLEKPATASEAEGEMLLAEAERSGVPVVPAHNVLFATGVEEILAGSGPLAHLRRRSPAAEDSPRAWSRPALFDILYHALVLVGRGSGGGTAEVLSVRFQGDGAPRRIRAELSYPRGKAELVLDFEAPAEEDTITRIRPGGGADVWRRKGRVVTLSTPDGTRTVPPEGSEVARMLSNFRGVVLGNAAAGATLREAIDVRTTAMRVLAALEESGAPFERAGAPRHVRSGVRS